MIPKILFAAMAASFAAFHGVAADIPPCIGRVVKIHSEAEIDSLQKCGAEILRRRGDILLCLMPLPAEQFKTMPRKARRPAPRISPTLDIAATHFGADGIRDGSAAGLPFTGKGVVAGICDIGFDPSHPNFRDADGRLRIGRISHYNVEDGVMRLLDSEEEMARWRTDDPDEYHATHVAGIMAGSGAGTPYTGMAPDADIAVSVSTLTDFALLAGAEDIIDFAKASGQRAVINMSVGSYNGPHDGTSLFCQYLDLCSDDAVFVLSAGNEGTHTNFLEATLSEGLPAVSFRIGNTSWNQFAMYGATDIWSSSREPLSVRLMVWDSVEKRVACPVAEFTLSGSEGELVWQLDGMDTPFEGVLYAEGGVDPDNGRHRTVISYDFTSGESAGMWARYELMAEVTAEPGTEVEVYADGTYSRLMGCSGSPAPGHSRSISDIACGHRIVSVGMYANRSSAPVTNHYTGQPETVYTGFAPQTTIAYSSYATLRDGRKLPLTVAPGYTLMSAVSAPYLEANPQTDCLLAGGAQWIPRGGTSMAAPYVAGCIAAWLEAAPDLTAEDIQDIIAASNRLDIPDPDDPHNGCGWFDPAEGLRIALKMAGVDSVADPLPLLRPSDPVEVRDMAGVKRYAGEARGLSGIGKGIYIVRTPYGTSKMAL